MILSASNGALIKTITPPFSFSKVDLPYKSLGMNSGDEIVFSGAGIASFTLSSTSYSWII